MPSLTAEDKEFLIRLAAAHATLVSRDIPLGQPLHVTADQWAVYLGAAAGFSVAVEGDAPPPAAPEGQQAAQAS